MPRRDCGRGLLTPPQLHRRHALRRRRRGPARRECRGGVCLPPGGAIDGGGGSGDAGGGPGTVEVLVKKNVTAGGTVSIGATSCGPGCAQLASPYNRDGTVTLRIDAFPAPGWTFRRWTGDCSGPSRICELGLDGDHMVQAEFFENRRQPHLHHVAAVPRQLRRRGGVDRPCQQRAQAAGLTGTWHALAVSDSGGLLGRLIYVNDDATTARGFVRMDGEIVADTAEIWSSTTTSATRSCTTSSAAGPRGRCGPARSPAATPRRRRATSGAGASPGRSARPTAARRSPTRRRCRADSEAALICAMVDRRITMPPIGTPPAGSKQIFVSSVALLGNTVATAGDEVCAQDRTGAKALVATTRSSAGALLQAGTQYYRPDGVFIGSGAEILGGRPRTGIWLEATGNPSVLRYVWTGSTGIGALASASTNCDDWTDVVPNGIVGSTTGDDSWWRAPGSRLCAGAYITYCVDP